MVVYFTSKIFIVLNRLMGLNRGFVFVIILHIIGLCNLLAVVIALQNMATKG